MAKGKVNFLKNLKEINKVREEGERMGLSETEIEASLPEEELEEEDVLFRMDKVIASHMAEDNSIAIYLVSGERFSLEYDGELWEKINEYLKNK